MFEFVTNHRAKSLSTVKEEVRAVVEQGFRLDLEAGAPAGIADAAILPAVRASARERAGLFPALERTFEIRMFVRARACRLRFARVVNWNRRRTKRYSDKVAKRLDACWDAGRTTAGPFPRILVP